MNLTFGKDEVNILCLGAHSDDIEIGCGGTLLYLKSLLRKVRLHWVVFSANGVRGAEAAMAAELFTSGCEKTVVFKNFRDGYLPHSGPEVKDFFEELKSQVQ